MNELHKKGRVQCFTNLKDLKGDLDAHSTRDRVPGMCFSMANLARQPEQ